MKDREGQTQRERDRNKVRKGQRERQKQRDKEKETERKREMLTSFGATYQTGRHAYSGSNARPVELSTTLTKQVWMGHRNRSTISCSSLTWNTSLEWARKEMR